MINFVILMILCLLMYYNVILTNMRLIMDIDDGIKKIITRDTNETLISILIYHCYIERWGK